MAIESMRNEPTSARVLVSSDSSTHDNDAATEHTSAATVDAVLAATDAPHAAPPAAAADLTEAADATTVERPPPSPSLQKLKATIVDDSALACCDSDATTAVCAQPASALLQPPPTMNDAESTNVQDDCARLFIVCGRGRTPDDLRALFATCGAIQHLHFALDRNNKSRGFAFLQYSDPASTADAIARFHGLRLPDGHVLKVTVAKDKPVGRGAKKLKRNQQQSNQDATLDDRDGANDGDDVMNASTSHDASLHTPGKRQRSSPPSLSLSLPALALDAAAALQAAEHERSTSISLPLQAPVEAPDIVVMRVLDDIMTTLERIRDSAALVDSYALVAVRSLCSSSASNHNDECSTEQLTSSIDSFTLNAVRSSSPSLSPSPSSWRLQQRRLRPSAPTFTMHQQQRSHLLRRRRLSSDDDSDECCSSLDGGTGHRSDASGTNRRKRSNVSHRPLPPTHWLDATTTNKCNSDDNLAAAQARVSVHVALPSHATSAAATRTTATPTKKPGKRQSSDRAAESPARSSKQRVTQTTSRTTTMRQSPPPPVAAAVAVASSLASLAHPAPPVTLRFTQRMRLFFVASRKCTHQELVAMFCVYGDLDCVTIVSSYGRIQTMAYITYTNPETAATVLASFEHDDSDTRDDPNEVMKLTYADDDDASSLVLRPQLRHAAPTDELVPPRPTSRWLLVQYDRSIASSCLSNRVAQCDGMEFVDIKVDRSSRDPQGVAFVKFATAAQAADAAHVLHDVVLADGGATTPLQATVVDDPSRFSTHAPIETEFVQRSYAARDDVDVSAVEARFAHLMHSNTDATMQQQQWLATTIGVNSRRHMSIEETHAPPLYYHQQQLQLHPTPQYHPYEQQQQYHHQSMFQQQQYELAPLSTYYHHPPAYDYYNSHSLAPSSLAPWPQASIGASSPVYYPHHAPLAFREPSPAHVGSYNHNTNSSGPIMHYVTPPSQQQQQQQQHSGPPGQQTPPARTRTRTPKRRTSIKQRNRGDDPTTNHHPVTREATAVATLSKAPTAAVRTNSSSDGASSVDSASDSGSIRTTASAATSPAAAIYIASSRPFELAAVVQALSDCSGVVAITRDYEHDSDGTTDTNSSNTTIYVVDFIDAAQAADAVIKLDGRILCSSTDQKLRVALVSPRSAAPSRRKRQRVDPRHRK